MKYNVGDKVIERGNLDFFFNPFWSKNYRCFSTVTEANEEYFSVYKPNKCDSAIQEGLSCGANEYMIFYQGSGKTKNWSSSTTYLHVEKDRDLILSIINKLGEKEFDKNKKYYENDIKRIERTWEDYQKFHNSEMQASIDFLKYE